VLSRLLHPIKYRRYRRAQRSTAALLRLRKTEQFALLYGAGFDKFRKGA